MALTPSTLINGRYELTSFISEGGMGEVWKAVDRRLNRPVAIKTVRSRYLQAEPKALSIFHDEAKAGAHLMGHANIVGVLDIIEQAGGGDVSCFIVMEYVDGVSLSRWISDVAGRIDSEILYFLNLQIAWQFCRAIQAAHKSGVLHRDIKPLNAILSKGGRLKVTDFGLARFVDAVTRTHTVAGAKTAAYAAPEQWRDEKHAESTDVYQLGCALYHLFTGGLPFDKKSLPALMTAHLSEAPKSLRERNALVSEEIDLIIRSMLEKDPGARDSLWKLNDALCVEMCRGYRLGFDFKGMSEDAVDLIHRMTDIRPSDDDPNGTVTVTFPDAHEVLEEGIALSLAGIPFSLERGEVVPLPGAEAPAPEAPAPEASAPSVPQQPHPPILRPRRMLRERLPSE